MKHFYLKSVLLCLLMMAGANATAHDIAVNNADGVTIYYKWINYYTALEVTYRGISEYSYSNEYTGNVVIPESVTYNGTSYSVTSIGDGAFCGCSGLTSIEIPNSVTSIGRNAFYDCTGLTSIEIPNSVTSIGYGTFWDCSGLTSIEIPNSVTTIGDYAFNGCKGLTSIEIPNSVTSIGSDTFYDTAWYYNQPDGVVYAGNVAYNYKGTMPENTAIVLKEGTVGITGSAFYGCTGLTSIEIPNSVTSIGEDAFKGCTGLTSIEIPNSVTSIGERAFYNCTGLKSVTIGDSVTSIGERAFYNCTGLKSVTIGDNVRSIGNDAFYNCYNATFYVNRGTTSLLTLWDDGRTPKETETNKWLYKPYISYNATQTTLNVEIVNIYNEYTNKLNGEDISEGRSIVLKGLRPGYSQDYKLIVSSENKSIMISETVSTQSISPSVKLKSTASSVSAIGSYIKGDAHVVSQSIRINGEEYDGNNSKAVGLTPNREYEAKYIIKVAYGENEEYTYSYYSATEKLKTLELTLTTQQPKVISAGNVIVAAESNLDDDETNVGFEWRRTDWGEDFASNTGGAYLYEGTMEGYIRNLYTEKLWKYRPYYESSDGNRYYGEWVGIDPTNTSYFEPTVHTYAQTDVNGNSAAVKGYAMRGTDNVTSQGFKYWKVDASEEAMMRRAAEIPTNAMTVEAKGNVMTATLDGLDYSSKYCYVAFVTTSEGETFYGEQQTFVTAEDPNGIDDVTMESSDSLQSIRKGIYTLQGVKVADDNSAIKSLSHGLYIINGRKVLLK